MVAPTKTLRHETMPKWCWFAENKPHCSPIVWDQASSSSRTERQEAAAEQLSDQPAENFYRLNGVFA
jgi:hypothetical protein